MGWNAGFSRIALVSLMGTTGASALMSASACSSSSDGKSLARDVNGDGFDDVVIGVWRDRTGGGSAGAAYALFGGKQADAEADGALIGWDPAGRLGSSVTVAGDLNGDGFADLVVSARGPYGRYGHGYIFFGGDGASLELSPDGEIGGDLAPGSFGGRVQAVGDVNGDGYDDLAAAAREGTLNVHVYFGGAGASFDGVTDAVLVGEGTGELGLSLRGAGDVNGDGFDDLLLGEPSRGLGQVRLFFGARSFDAEADVVFAGGVAGDGFGMALAGMGDLNGDGYDDLAIGAPATTIEDPNQVPTRPPPVAAGRVYFFLGGAAIDTKAVASLSGTSYGESFGSVLSGGGDLNGDGFADAVVATPDLSPENAVSGGKLHVLFGGADFDAGEASVLRSSTDFAEAVAPAGDFNGDGYDDLIVVNPQEGEVDGLPRMIGAASLFYGGSGRALDGEADVTFFSPGKQFIDAL